MNTIHISEHRYWDMVHGKAVDVTQEEFMAAVRKSFHKGAPRFKSALCFNYPELSRQTRDYGLLRKRCRCIGLNPDEHELKFKLYKNEQILLVDGYWATAYKVLFIYEPSDIEHNSHLLTYINKAKSYLVEQGDIDSLALLDAKYGPMLEQREKQLRKLHGIPDGVKVDSISREIIDGISYRVWKALYDENHTTTKSTVSYFIRVFEEKGELDKVAILREKYKKLLNNSNPIPSMEHSDALSFRDYILSPEYREHLIERNRERSINDAADN